MKRIRCFIVGSALAAVIGLIGCPKKDEIVLDTKPIVEAVNKYERKREELRRQLEERLVEIRDQAETTHLAIGINHDKYCVRKLYGEKIDQEVCDLYCGVLKSNLPLLKLTDSWMHYHAEVYTRKHCE